jgi:hypothetical protein
VSLQVADFDHDGIPDIAVGNGDSISFLVGKGDGTFKAAVSFNGGAGVRGMAAGDFNGDGKTDLAAASINNNTVSVLINNSSGNLPSQAIYGAGANPNSITAADFNEDGKSDLAIANGGSNNITIELGNGGGTFGSATNLPVGSNPTAIASGDLNNDGHKDLAVANSNDATISILLGDGHGHFAAPSGGLPATVSLAPNTNPSSLIMEDLNADGKLDLAITYAGSSTVSILFGNGNGSFQTPVSYAAAQILSRAPAQAPGATSIGPRMLAVADFNGDGKKDLVEVVPFSNHVAVFFNNGNGTFTASGSYSTGSGNPIPLGVAAADFRGSGKADIAVLNNGTNTLSILLNNGSGAFPTFLEQATGSSPISITAMDINGDGKADLAWVNKGDNSVTILPGKGDGSFDSNAEATYAAGTQPYDLVIGSFTGGGLNDLAVANNSSNNVSVLLNLGADAVTTASSANPANFTQDIVLSTRVSGTVSGAGIPKGTLLYKDGNNLLGPPVTLYGSGQAVFSLPHGTLSVGSHPISVVYSGDGFFLANTSVFSQSVQSAPTSTAIISSGNPVVYGQAITFTATVTSAGGAPSGLVNFMEGNSLLGSGTLSGGQASFTTTAPLAVGTHGVTAIYPGSGSIFAGSSSQQLSQVITAASTTTTLVSSANPTSFGQLVTFTAVVSTAATGKPTGTVNFKDNGTLIGQGTLNNQSQATLPISTLSLGNHSITADYAGDSNFAGSSSAIVAELVQKGNSNLALTASPQTAAQGSPVTFTATLVPSTGTAGESIAFIEGSNTLGTGLLDTSGHASFVTNTLSLGPHIVIASYAGDNNLQGSVSSPAFAIVYKTSTTSLASSENPSTFGDSVTFTAIVTGAGGVPSQTVTFMDTFNAVTTSLGVAALDNTGHASFTTAPTALAAGLHTIVANYSGDGNFAPSASPPLAQVVNTPSTLQTTLTHSPEPVHVGKKLTFTAIVANSGNAIPNFVFTESLAGAFANVIVVSDHGPCAGTAQIVCLLGTLNQGDQATITVTLVPLLTRHITASAGSNANANVIIDKAKVNLRPFRH